MLKTVDDAIRAAQRSTLQRFKTGAAIYDKRWNLLSLGWSHVPQARLIRTPWSKHAELHAVERCRQLGCAAHIVIATMTRHGGITCAAPCCACQDVLDKYELTPHYTDWCANAA